MTSSKVFKAFSIGFGFAALLTATLLLRKLIPWPGFIVMIIAISLYAIPLALFIFPAVWFWDTAYKMDYQDMRAWEALKAGYKETSQLFDAEEGRSIPTSIKKIVTNKNTFNGSVTNSSLNQGGVQINNSHLTATGLTALLSEVEAQLYRTSLPNHARALLQPDVDTLKAQAKKDNPSSVIVREAVASMRAIAENALGSLAGTGLGAALGSLTSAVSG